MSNDNLILKWLADPDNYYDRDASINTKRRTLSVFKNTIRVENKSGNKTFYEGTDLVAALKALAGEE